jgi:hypothetical protein
MIFLTIPVKTVFGPDVSRQKSLPVIMAKKIQTNNFLGSAFDGERIGSLNFYHNFLHHRRFGDEKHRVLQLYYVVQRSTNRGAQKG